MDASQNSNIDVLTLEVEKAVAAQKQLSFLQQMIVDHKAVGGLIVDEETGVMSRMTMDQLAEKCGVTKDALYKAKYAMVDYWERVNRRRIELTGRERLGKVHIKWFTEALKMENWPLTEAWLRNFDPNYRMPAQKVEHEMGNSWAALINSKKIIEGEITNATSAD